MTRTAKKHSAVFAQLLARKMLEQGHDASRVFDGTGYDRAFLDVEAPTSDFSATADFFEQAAVLADVEVLGFRFGQEVDIRQAGLIGYVGLAAPTVVGFLTNVARYTRVFGEALEMDVSQLPDEGVLYWQYGVSNSLKRRQYVEFSSVCFLETLRQYSGQRIAPRRVSYQHRRRRGIDEMQAYFGCPIEFGAARNFVSFRPADLDLPLTSADCHLLKVLQQYADQMLSQRGRHVSGVVVDVERAIADQLAAGATTLETVANGMGMSPRTLSRKLAREDTSFFRILEGLRKSMAKSYLKDSDLVLAEIAFLLGYSGLSSFSDAFKRWTGHSPGQFRLQ